VTGPNPRPAGCVTYAREPAGAPRSVRPPTLEVTVETVAKPAELLALHDVTEELFGTLQGWFAVPTQLEIDLTDVDSAVAQLADPVAIAGLAMRKLQALRLLAQPGVRTSTDVVVTIVQDLDRALAQAPTMRLHRAAAAADWDAEFADLLDGGADAAAAVADPALEGTPSSTPGDDDATTGDTSGGDGDVPVEDTGGDPEVRRFRELHGRLHAAARAVVEASDGEIRYLL
jgi:hypothetical protein